MNNRNHSRCQGVGELRLILYATYTMTILRKGILIGLGFILVGSAGLVSYNKWQKNKHVSLVSIGSQTYPIVVLGDSLAAGVGSSSTGTNFAGQILDKIRTKQSGATMYNLGLSGARIGDVRDGQVDQVAALKPQIIFLIIGTNDVIHSTGENSFSSDYDSVIQTLSKQGVPIVVCNIPDFSLTPIIPSSLQHLADHQTGVFNGIIDDVIKNNSLVREFDFYTLSKTLLTNSVLISADGFHPNDAGYAQLANSVWDYIQ